MTVKIEKIVGRICSSCIFSCYKENCERKNWQEKTYPPIPKVGKDTECPMLQFEAIKPTKADYNTLGDLSITVKETLAVCQKCKYVGESDSLDGFADHCCDCLNNQIKESLEEAMVEACIS